MKSRLLNWKEPQKTTYCIPVSLRDEQIKWSTSRVKGRIEPGERKEDPIAIVCFGPSLSNTWEMIKDFKYKYIMSMSGSTKFLLSKGLTPNWHVSVDPRVEQVLLLGEPDPRIEYLLSSTCHPVYFDFLEQKLGKSVFEKRVKLWHVFDASDNGQRIIPRGEWALTGGCDVGLRSLTIASFLGFRNLHIFGMDHSAGTVDKPAMARHAGPHPDSKGFYDICEYEGVKYLTTPGMLEAARQLWHELDQLPAVNPVFYGEGLCQHMAKSWKSKPETEASNIIAFVRPELISQKHKDLNARLHRDNPAYGIGGEKHANVILKLSESLKSQSVLDYGAGKGTLGKAMPFPIWQYDPAIPGIDEPPRPADIVNCTDVLEHIEPDKLDAVLNDLKRCILKIGYFVIHTTAASKKYADGSNTHLIQQGLDFWKKKLEEHFAIGKVFSRPSELIFVVGPLKGKKSNKVCSLPKRTIPSDEKLKVVIGATRKDKIPALVTEWSIRQHSSCDVEIIHTFDKELSKRDCPTGFSFVRFHVPKLCQYQGYGLYLDSDMIVYGDVRDLLEIDMSYYKVIRSPNQTAVLLYNCDLEKLDAEYVIKAIDNGEYTYNDLFWKLKPIQEAWTGYLPDEWNLLDRWRENGKLLHYTKVATQPWIYPGHPLGSMWYEALSHAIGSGLITPEMVSEDEKLGYINPECGIIAQANKVAELRLT